MTIIHCGWNCVCTSCFPATEWTYQYSNKSLVVYSALEYLCGVFVVIPSFPTFFHHQTSTLPVVIVSNANQISSAWASILWFIMLSTDTKVRTCFLTAVSRKWALLFSYHLYWNQLFSALDGEGLSFCLHKSLVLGVL